MNMIDYYEAQELACAVLGLDYDEILDEGKENEIENFLYEKFCVSLEQFIQITSALLTFTPTIQSPLTNISYNAFVKEDSGMLISIVKREHIND